MLNWLNQLLLRIGSWKAAQGPEADGLHAMIGYSAILTAFRINFDIWIAAAIMMSVAAGLETFDHYYEPPHPLKGDLIDFMYYGIGTCAGVLVVYAL